MKILVVQPKKKPDIREIDDSLESMQAVVGGSIEAIYPFEDSSIALVCNDEGKLNGEILNRALRDEDGEIYDIIAGTFFICSAPPNSDSFTGLAHDQIAEYRKRFAVPELFLNLDGQLLVCPCID